MHSPNDGSSKRSIRNIGIIAVDGLIDCRRRIDGAAIGPHAFIPALTGEVVRFGDQRLALASLLRRPIARDFESSFLRALRSPPDNGAG